MRLFDYHRPTTVAETLGLHGRARRRGRAAGRRHVADQHGQARARRARARHRPAAASPELHGLTGTPDRGAAGSARWPRSGTSRRPALVRGLAPGLAEAAHHVATVRIRNQATVGGNLVHADPNQDLPPMLMVHDAVARITGPQRRARRCRSTDMFVGFFETVLEEGEILELRARAAAPAGPAQRLPQVPAAHPGRLLDDRRRGRAGGRDGRVDRRPHRGRRWRRRRRALPGGRGRRSSATATATRRWPRRRTLVPGELDPISDCARIGALQARHGAGLRPPRLLRATAARRPPA